MAPEPETAVTPPTAKISKTRKKRHIRPILRALHRDIGYVAVGLTVTYAASGLAVNHIADWDPNFRNTSEVRELGPLSGDDQAIASRVRELMGIREVPREVYRTDDDFEILFEHRTLHVNATTGHTVDDAQKPRFFIRVANWLHLNRGKKAWTYFADAYAAALLFLATSGLFMLAGKKGLVGRGAIFVAIGIAIPLAYVSFTGN